MSEDFRLPAVSLAAKRRVSRSMGSMQQYIDQAKIEREAFGFRDHTISESNGGGILAPSPTINVKKVSKDTDSVPGKYAKDTEITSKKHKEGKSTYSLLLNSVHINMLKSFPCNCVNRVCYG